MKFDRLAKLLLEMPAKNVERLGSEDDWETRGAYDKKSHALLTHPEFDAKVTRAFAKSEVDLNFYFINNKEMVEDPENNIGYSTSERGGIDASSPFWGLIGVDYEDVHDPDAITIIFNGNFGDQLVEFTPWIIAHRLSHSLKTTATTSKFSGLASAYEQMEDGLKFIISDVADYYGLERKLGKIGKDWTYNQSTLPYINGVLNAIGAFASARKGKIDRPYEFIHELVAQYLITGKIVFRSDFPDIKIVDQEYKQHYPKGEEYEDEYTEYLRYSKIDGEDANMDSHGRTIEYYVEDIINSAIGTVYLM